MIFSPLLTCVSVKLNGPIWKHSYVSSLCSPRSETTDFVFSFTRCLQYCQCSSDQKLRNQERYYRTSSTMADIFLSIISYIISLEWSTNLRPLALRYSINSTKSNGLSSVGNIRLRNDPTCHLQCQWLDNEFISRKKEIDDSFISSRNVFFSNRDLSFFNSSRFDRFKRWSINSYENFMQWHQHRVIWNNHPVRLVWWAVVNRWVNWIFIHRNRMDIRWWNMPYRIFKFLIEGKWWKLIFPNEELSFFFHSRLKKSWKTLGTGNILFLSEIYSLILALDWTWQDYAGLLRWSKVSLLNWFLCHLSRSPESNSNISSSTIIHSAQSAHSPMFSR